MRYQVHRLDTWPFLDTIHPMPLQTLHPKLAALKPPTPKTTSQTKRITGSGLQRIRRTKLARNPACEICARSGIVTPATDVDHITPLWAGGSESDQNRQSLCSNCHAEKTAQEAAMRSAGVLAGG